MHESPAQEERGVREQVIRRMAHLLEIAYMAFDQKKFNRCIQLCETLLLMDPQYAVALEFRENCEKCRHGEAYFDILAFKVEVWKKLTDDDEKARIPWPDSVRIPSREEWAEVARHLPGMVMGAGEGSAAETLGALDIQGIHRKLDTMEVDLAFDNSRLEDILAYIRDFSGLNLLLDSEVRDMVDPDRIMSFNVKGLALKHALGLLLSGLGLEYVVTDEAVVLLTAPYRVPFFTQQR